jgi:hypothetical protein
VREVPPGALQPAFILLYKAVHTASAHRGFADPYFCEQDTTTQSINKRTLLTALCVSDFASPCGLLGGGCASRP